jgi:hypothetical protein
MVRLSWVCPVSGYKITEPLSHAQAEAVARELKQKFPLVHETLTIHPCQTAQETP